MDTSALFVGFAAGLLIGAVAAAVIVYTLFERQRRASSEALIETLRLQVAELTRQANREASAELLQMAGTQFDSQLSKHSAVVEGEKALIDQRVTELTGRLGQVEALIGEFEQSRAERLGALGEELRSLTASTDKIGQALTSNKARGQWGERIAEDAIRAIGLIEGLHYKTQVKEYKNGTETQPDFTFFLPLDKRLNMDCKFPLANYLRALEAESESERQRYMKTFLKDVRMRVSEVTTRNYIAPEHGTVDVALIFIPNESLYQLIHENDPTLLDFARSQKVVLVSPYTLYMVLAVIREAVDNFTYQEKAQQIATLMREFRKEWLAYTGKLVEVRKQLDLAHNKFSELLGERTTRLDKALEAVALYGDEAAATEQLPLAAEE
ncbi:MAG: DNA recombination protein RmuC [Anaerolineae bacterium]|nr:DNA recombination protein RmuC [Anaerolineae bacterium]